MILNFEVRTMKGGVFLSLELENLKNQLQNCVNDPNADIDKILEVSTNIDKIIMKEHILKNEIDYIKKYETYIERDDKAKIMMQMRSELVEKYKIPSQKEIEIITSNFYDFCCLSANEISTNEIIKYFLYKNNKIYESTTEEERNTFVSSSIFNLKDLNELSAKYVKSLKTS